MPYVSCRYGPPPPEGFDPPQIICTDDQGREWTVPSEDCDVGDWLAFKEQDGEVLAYEAPEPEEEGDAA